MLCGHPTPWPAVSRKQHGDQSAAPAAPRSCWHSPYHQRTIRHQPVGPSSSWPVLAQAAEAQRGRETRMLHTDCKRGTASPESFCTQGCLVCLEEKNLHVISYKSMASSCHPYRTVLLGTSLQAYSLYLCRAQHTAASQGKGFSYFFSMRLSLSWLLVNMKSLRRQCQRYLCSCVVSKHTCSLPAAARPVLCGRQEHTVPMEPQGTTTSASKG